MSALLEIRDLAIDFELGGGVVHAVRGIDLSVAAGEIVALVGESGSGKSATALSVLRLNPEPPCVYRSGQVLVGGDDLLAASPARLRRARGGQVAMIFQEPMTSLNPTKRVGRQVAEPLLLHRGVSGPAAQEAALQAMAAAGIPDPQLRAGQFPHQLSGGLRQRVMIAMALVAEPTVLIADEPTTALDVTVQAQILEQLVRIRDERGMGILLITHDLGVVAEVADRVAVMQSGRIVESGPVLDVFAAPAHEYTRRLLAATPRLETATGGER